MGAKNLTPEAAMIPAHENCFSQYFRGSMRLRVTPLTASLLQMVSKDTLQLLLVTKPASSPDRVDSELDVFNCSSLPL